MSYEQIKASLAPCGLSCEKCFAHVDGDIRQYTLFLAVLSRRLTKAVVSAPHERRHSPPARHGD